MAWARRALSNPAAVTGTLLLADGIVWIVLYRHISTRWTGKDTNSYQWLTHWERRRTA